MKLHEQIEDPVFREAVDKIDSGDFDALRHVLTENPDLATQRVSLDVDEYFSSPSLLEFVAENPIRQGQVSTNAVEIARTIIDAGADNDSINSTLGLVASGRIVRECKLQKPLIDLLCENGADANVALLAALAHGEFDAVRALIANGATQTLEVAAAMGDVDAADRLINDAGETEKHFAFALATQFGRTDVVKMLLDASVDPNRYNPDGAHAHSTPLHQAALGGHFEVVKLLVEHGADTTAKDTLHDATAQAWATHGDDARTIEYLNQIENNSSAQSKP